jgi:undecaprenyl-diphosphatase
MAYQSSLISSSLHRIGHGFADGWRAVPRGGFVRWLAILLGGGAACAGLVMLLVGLVRPRVEATDAAGEPMLSGPLGEWDYDTVAAADRWPISFTDGIILESPANIFILGPLTLLAAAACFWHKRTLAGLTVILCYGIARLLIWTGWGMWPRERPQMIEGGAAALSAHSFPSGHAMLSLTTYGLLTFFLWRATRSWLDRLAGLALLVGVVLAVGAARLRLGAHYPTDVLAGWAVGLAWLVVCCVALKVGDRTSTA